MMRFRKPAWCLVLVAVGVAVSGCSPAGSTAERGQAYDFELTSLNGEQVSRANFPDQFLVLDFWATWCLPCVVQHQALEEVAAGLGPDDGVTFLAIDVGEPEETVREFLEDKEEFPFPVLLDAQETMAAQHGILILPTIVVLDPEGRVVFRREGVTPASILRNSLTEILSEAPAAGSL